MCMCMRRFLVVRDLTAVAEEDETRERVDARDTAPSERG